MKTQSAPADGNQNIENQLTLEDYLCDGTSEDVAQLYASLPSVAASLDFGPFDTNVVVIDTETTGLSYRHDELIQIAAAKMNHGQIIDWYVTFVDPGMEIPEDIEHLTGIANGDVVGAPSPAEALEALVEFAGDAVMVAHNAGFDRHFVTNHVQGYPLLENLWIDSLDLARIALPRLRGHRLLDLTHAFNTATSTHRADDDVAATCAILRILLAGVSVMPPELICEISRMATVDEWSTVAVFDWFAQQMAEQPRLNLRALRNRRLSDIKRQTKYDAWDIDADEQLALTFPSAQEVSDAFEPEGAIGTLYPHYEMRPEQQEMSLAVREALSQSRNLIVEAGTGVGKSMAYLLPLALTAKQNKITVGVATKTNALLDQLVFHELPALSQALGGLTYAPLKGISHYPCLKKVQKLVEQGVKPHDLSDKDGHPAPALAALLSFISQTVYDDIDTLKINYQVLPRWAITTSSHDCLRRKCPYYGTACFVHGARRAAESADVVVTNHSLLFCDIVADGGLLPPVRHWVIDEAHGAESEARRAFSVCLAAEDLLRLSANLASDESSRNVFTRAERRVVCNKGQEEETLFYALIASAKKAGREFAQAAQDFAAHMKDLLYFDSNKRNKGYEIVELWLNDDVRASCTYSTMAAYGRTCMEMAGKLTRACQELVGYLEEVDNAGDVQGEIASIAMACKDIIGAGDIILGQGASTVEAAIEDVIIGSAMRMANATSGKYAYSATLSKKKDRPIEKLEALLLNVGNQLQETLYANTLSVIYASATISVGGSFSSFERAMGLNQDRFFTANTLQLQSSFDFDANMVIYVPKDIPEPTDSRYLAALKELLVQAHIAQRGSMLTLFTNRKEMESCFEGVQPKLKEDGLRLVCQKWGVSVKGLRDDFLKDEHLSLFALKSFWEGFDAPGQTLRGVIIPKLPFSKPSDPLSCERAARDDRAWWNYVLPAAVIDTKQAVGRLIRTATDRGIIILADKRLITKTYGKTFLSSLPSRNVRVCTMQEIVQELQEQQ